jgi:hypothetical protein
MRVRGKSLAFTDEEVEVDTREGSYHAHLQIHRRGVQW